MKNITEISRKEWQEVVADAREIYLCAGPRILLFKLKLKANNTVIKSAANRPMDHLSQANSNHPDARTNAP